MKPQQADAQACLSQKQKRTGNGFAARFQEFDRQLRTEGYPTADLRRNGQCLLAPGIAVKQYVETLRGVEKLEEVGGTIRYRQKAYPPTEYELAALILDGFINGTNAHWYEVVARTIAERFRREDRR